MQKLRKIVLMCLSPHKLLCGKIFRKVIGVWAICLMTFGVIAPAFGDYPIMAQRYAADPSGLEYNGRLYVYCSNDDDNNLTDYLMHSITCFSTDDLKNWTDHGVVFDAKVNTAWASLSWAPSVVATNGLFYLYFGNGANNIGVATSSVPIGPFVDARGSALISSSTPGASGTSQWYFDPCAFIDDDGQRYLYFGGGSSPNSRVIRLGANMTSTVGSATPMGTTNFFEASYMHKRNGIYYYTYSSQPTSTILCDTNSNPTNGFIHLPYVLKAPVNFNNNNQSSFFTYQGNWYCAYHNRYESDKNGISTGRMRNLCLDAVNYNANGTMQTVVCTTNGLPQLKYLNPYTRVEAETMAQASGIQTEPCSAGGMDVGPVTNNCWIKLKGVDFGSGSSLFCARVASAGSGGSIELRLDTLAGPLVGTCAVTPTGGWQTWVRAQCSISDAVGVHDLYIKFVGGSGNLFSFNWWQMYKDMPANTLPVANALSVTATQTVAKAIALAGSDADDDTLTYAIVTGPGHGTLSGTAPNLIYTSAADYNGSDSFTFKVNDGTVDSAVAPVSITVASLGMPAVNNSGGSMCRGETSAALHGLLTAGTLANAWICWGDHDGGTASTSVWDQVQFVGAVRQGVAFTAQVTGLATNRSYFYRCFVSNADGQAWSASAGSFSGTPVSGGVWTPLSISPCAWYDAADGGTLTSSSNAVSEWRDKSGNANHLTQGTLTLQPAISNAAINGLNGVNFTGDKMATASNPFGANVQDALVLVVHQVDAIQAGILFSLTGSSAAANRWQSHAPYSDGKIYFDCGNVGSSYRLSGNFGVTTGAVVMSGFYSSLSSNVQQIYKNGSLLYGDATGHDVPTAGAMWLGGVDSTYQDTTIGEVLIFNGVVSSADRQKLEGYLAGKWGLQETLPSNHLYKIAAPGGGGDGIGNLAPGGISSNQATLNGSLVAASTNYDVYVHWGASDGGIHAAAWGSSAYVGSWTNVTTAVSFVVGGMSPGQTCYYTFSASNEGTNVWAQPSWQFVTPGSYTGATCTLTVSSIYGTPSPSGATSQPSNAVITASILNSPVISGTTQYVCTGWSGTGSLASGSGASTTFTITNDTILTWQWKTNYWIGLGTSGAGTLSQASAWCAVGTNVVVNTTPGVDSVFDTWLGDTNGASISGTQITFAVNAPRNITASFLPILWNISASAGANGSVSPSGVVAVGQGSNQLFTITPNAACHVANVVVDSVSVGGVTGYTFTNVRASHTIAASFAVNRAPVVSAGTNQVIELAGAAWSPASVAPLAWYDAADAATIVQSGGTVSQWNDKSGHGRNVAQAIAANQPAYSAGAISFDGANDCLWNSAPFMWANGQADVYIVAAVNAAADARLVAEGSVLSTTPLYCPAQAGKTDLTRMDSYLRNDASVSIFNHGNLSAAAAFDNAVKIYQWSDTATNLSGRVNGGMETAIGYTRSGIITLNTFAVGACVRSNVSGWAQASIREIVITSKLSDADRQALEGCLAQKWSLGASLPAGHPYKAGAPGAAVATLDGTVSDADGDSLTTTWSVVSGPASVALTNSNAVDTTASFSTAGSYVLRLTASDGFTQTSSDITVTVVTNPVSQCTFTIVSAYGTPSPAGVTTSAWNTVIHSTLIDSPVFDGATQYVCKGWIGSGSLTNGSGTNTCFTITNNSTITWQWLTNCWIDFSVIGN